MAGTPLMELVAALEREEEMQTDGAVDSSDAPATPTPIVHPEDPLLAESRPSTGRAGAPPVMTALFYSATVAYRFAPASGCKSAEC